MNDKLRELTSEELDHVSGGAQSNAGGGPGNSGPGDKNSPVEGPHPVAITTSPPKAPNRRRSWTMRSYAN